MARYAQFPRCATLPARLRARAARAACTAGDAPGGNGRVGPCGGLAARNVVRHYHALLARVGLARRPFHHLRHTAAGWLLAEGADLRVVQQVLGHSQLALTANLYVHIMPTLLREAAYGRAAGRGPLANWHPNWHQPAGPGRRRAAQRHKRRCALSSFWRNDGEKWG